VFPLILIPASQIVALQQVFRQSLSKIPSAEFRFDLRQAPQELNRSCLSCGLAASVLVRAEIALNQSKP
jgi:hypothetical protein